MNARSPSVKELESAEESKPIDWRKVSTRSGFLLFAITAPLGWATVGLLALFLLLPLLIRPDDAEGQGISGFLRSFGPISIPTAAFVGVALCSALYSGLVRRSLFFGQVETTGIAFPEVHIGLAHAALWMVMAAVGLAAAQEAAKDRQFFLRWIVPVFLIAMTVNSGFALHQYFVEDVRRASGLLSYVNRMGTLLVFFGLWGAGYLMSVGGRMIWWLFPYVLTVLTALGTTLSRAGWLAAFAGGLVMALRGKRRLIFIGAAVLIILIVLFSMESTWLSRLQTITMEDNSSRIVLWEAALDIWRDYPILGAGPGSFLTVSEAYLDRYTGHATPHNLVLSIAAELGLVGMIAFGWIILRAARYGLRLWRHGDPFYVGLTAAVFALFLNDLFGQGFYTTQIGPLMWLGIGLLAAFGQRAEKEI